MPTFDFGTLLQTAIFDGILPIIFTTAFVGFLWGAFQYFLTGLHDEHVREAGKTLMLYSIFVFLLMILMWGIASAVQDSIIEVMR